MSIEAITLDLDDTLWPVDAVIERAERTLHEWLEQRAPRLAAALPPAQFALYRRALARDLPAIAHDFTALRREALRRALGTHAEDPGLAEPAMDVFLAARNDVELFPDAHEALTRMASRYRIVVVSNGNADVARIGIDGFFAAVVNARSAGVAKPDPRIFQAAWAQIDARPEDVLHVGDDPELDVRGAARAGTRAAWINRHRRPWAGDPVEAMVEFHDMLTLCDWLGV